MKKITLFIVLMSFTFGYAQQQTYNVTFETGTTGSTVASWSTFENGSNQPLEIVANPSQTGINTSATVAKFTALSAGQPWAGTQSGHANLGTWILESGNNTISIMVYKPVISDVGIKFVNSTDGTIFELKQPNTKINTWEKLTYDISSFVTSGENHNIDRLVVFPDWTARAQDDVCYFDNVTWSAKKTADPAATPPVTTSTDPTVAAPTPTEPAANVISVYSDAYTSITGVNTNPGWGQSTITSEISIGGNHALKYANLNYQGTDFAGNHQDVTGMTHVHFDYYTTDATALKFYLINDPANGGANEQLYDVAAQDGIVKNAWVSKNVPLSYYSNLGLPLNAIWQFKVVGDGTIYFDNFYFVNDATLAVNKFNLSQMELYPNPTSQYWNINSNNSTISSVTVYDILGRQVLSVQPKSKNVRLNASSLTTGMYFAKIKTDKGLSSIKLIKN